jgi:hypothetical protein
MSERPIWRPNSFTPDEWNRLSREDQIRWWKDRQPKPQRLDPMKAIRLFRMGTITALEMPGFVFVNLTKENVQQFLGGCPSEELQVLRQKAASLPANADEEGWSRLVSIQSACHDPWVTEDEIRQDRQETDRRFRQGVELFRTAEQG